MSSSFTDQPPPHDPQGDPGYTPTPPAPGRRPGLAGDRDSNLPRLGSLAQKARGQELQKAKRILLVIGFLTVILNLILVLTTPTMVKGEVDKAVLNAGGPHNVDPVEVQRVTDHAIASNYVIHGIFFSMGLLFVLFGFLIYRIPIAATVISLILYVLATLFSFILAIADEQPAVGFGGIVRILIIIALAKSVQSAFAYEKSRRVEEDFGTA